MTRVHYFSKYSALGPSSRYRAYQFQNDFRKAGWTFEIYPLFEEEYFSALRDPIKARQIVRKSAYSISRFADRLFHLSNGDADLIVIEQQLFPYLPFVLEKQFLPGEFLLEIDDAIYLTHPQKLPKLFQEAKCVVAGNEILESFVLQFQRNVEVIPTTIDTNQFRPIERMPGDKIVIGWSGLEYNFKYLHEIVPVLKDMLQQYSAELVILSGTPPDKFPVPYRFEKWDSKREAEQIGLFDIGLMPLKIDEWSKGKCAMKLLQYMAVGVPGIATAVGVNTKIIEDGINGFVAVTLDDWRIKLKLLLEDTTLRKSMGIAARTTIVNQYSKEVWFPKLLDVYKRNLS
jgi:glycosyltransferase involved in cell wall biosynthesis